MTTEEFQKNGPLQARLTEILADPAFQTAVSAIKDATEPRPGTHDVNPVMKAAKFDQRAGMNALLTHLSDLTKQPVERKVPKMKGLAKTTDDIPPEQ